MNMAAEGEKLILESRAPKIDGAPVFLGEIDGNDRDVEAAAKNSGMRPYWHYVGHRYDRGFVRILKAAQPVRIVMTLTAPAEAGVLTSDPEPIMNGDTLTWELQAGERIVFRDGLSKVSLTRLNSYIPIDQIALYPL